MIVSKSGLIKPAVLQIYLLVVLCSLDIMSFETHQHRLQAELAAPGVLVPLISTALLTHLALQISIIIILAILFTLLEFQTFTKSAGPSPGVK